MAEMENDENYSEEILSKLSDSLTKSNDRILFNLQPAETNLTDKSDPENTE